MKIALLTTDNREPFKDHANPQPWFGTAPEALLQGFAQLKDVEVHVICCLRQPAPSPPKLADNIWYHSLVVPKWGWMTTGFQGCIRAVRRKLREIQPDLVHGQGTERESALCAVFSGFPNVLTIHGNMRSVARVHQARPFSYNWLAARFESLALARTHGVVCITTYTQRSVSDLARRTWLLPNAVDEAFYKVPSRPADSQTVLCVANIALHKNQNELMLALDALAAQERFKLLFLGGASKDYPYGAEFFQCLAARPWCEWGGSVGRERLRELLAQAAAVVLPSLEDNCPMVILEAAAAGVPVAGAAIGGIPDLIDHGRTGLLFDPRQRAQIAESVRQLLADRPAALRMAAIARQEAQERFHPVAVAAKHLDIYRQVLQNLPPHSP
jgi:glycosyltransferase involved in cell wall biosynthesis